jgi:hypothetical protein
MKKKSKKNPNKCLFCHKQLITPVYLHRKFCSTKCSHSFKEQENRQNLLGQIFNRWTVLKEGTTRFSKRKDSKCGTVKRRYWVCQCICGTIKEIEGYSLIKGSSKSCGCLFQEVYSGENHPWWTGGKSLSHGYILIRNPDKNKYGSSDRIGEHRKVMIDFLKRPMYDNENVHHINGVRDDNRIENLELWIKSQPPGQRVIDIVKWAKEILKRYEQ